jgi:hypothetical protein
MKSFFTLLALFFTLSLHAQLWTEDFSSEASGSISGAAGGTIGGTWTVTTLPSGTFSRQNVGFPLFLGPVFQINNTGTEGVWETNVVDISSVGYAIISADVAVGGFGFSASDYIRFYYKLDGGPEVLFADIAGSLLSITSEASAIVAANTLQIVVRGNDNSFFGYINFDNISITAAPIIYSRKSGSWTDVTGGFGGTGTWSLVSHTGTACGCYPLNTQVAIIGNGHTVTLPASQTAVGIPPTTNLAPGAVDVQNTGTLQFNTNGITLGIQAGLLRVRNGGTINSLSGAVTGEQIQFQANVGGARLQVDAGGTASFEDLVLSTGATNIHFLEGGGSLTITDDVIINADDATLTNNMTSTVAVADRIQFSAGTTNASFVNNGTVTAATLFFDDDNNSITNTGTLTGAILVNSNTDDGNVLTNNSGATFNTTSITLNNGNFTLNNSGTINQSGTFVTNDPSSNFNNLNGAVWNYSGTGHDTSTRLLANNGTNNFNYVAAGDQEIITPVVGNGYSNISLQNSGAKTALGSFNVYGNWSRTGAATFAPAGFTVTLSGTGAQTISAVGGETFAGLTINNSFATSPQITLNNPVTVTGTLTMTDGNVNLNGNTFSIGLSAAAPGVLSHAGAAANGWMYGGSLIRNVPTTAIVIGAVAGFFPIGSSSNFRPFFIEKNNIASSGGALTLTFTEASTTSNVSITDGAATITRRHDSFWSLSTSGITAGTWSLRAGGTNFGTIQELLDLRMSTSSGVVGTNATATGSIADPRVNRTGLTVAELANNFHVASTDAVNSPLPITLLYLKADQVETAIEVQWATSMQEDFSHFVLQHSLNGTTFTDLTEVPGAGYNTEGVNEYNYIHKMPKIGINYYRLKAVDLDGTFEYFGPVAEQYTGEEALWIFPNPSNGDKVVYQTNFTPNESDRVLVYNQLGSVVADEPAIKNNGTVYFSESLKAGAYILKYSAGQQVLFARFIVVK